MRRKAKVLVPPELIDYENLGKMAMMIDLIGQALGNLEVELVHKSTQQGRKHEIIFREKNGGAIVSAPSSPRGKLLEEDYLKAGPPTDEVSKPFGGRKKSAKPLGSRPWSVREEELLIEYHLNGWNAKQIGEQLQSTEKSIATRTSKLRTAGRIPESSPSREGKEWTRKEDKRLSKLFKQYPQNHGRIAILMGRTPRAIISRLWQHKKARVRDISLERIDEEEG